ncbi:MAG: hypothetical protein IPJ82_16440 [Lewinellaceae bacterium]|nr:hypothetical protein [Lewinellaceae bacterium]
MRELAVARRGKKDGGKQLLFSRIASYKSQRETGIDEKEAQSCLRQAGKKGGKVLAWEIIALKRT